MVQKALKAGVGARVQAYVGAMVDDRYQPPVLLNGTVAYIRENPVNTEVVIKTGSLYVIVTENANPTTTKKTLKIWALNPEKPISS